MSNQNFEEKVATPYAEALVANAKNLDLLAKYKEELSSILSVLLKSEELQSLLLNPLISKIIKKKVLKELFEEQVQNFIMNFLLVLVDRRRISFLKTIIKKYLEIAYSLESITIVQITSVVNLNDEQKLNLTNKIKLLTGSNEVELLIKQNPSLIGGFIIKIGSKVIDASLIGKLNKMSSYLNVS